MLILKEDAWNRSTIQVCACNHLPTFFPNKFITFLFSLLNYKSDKKLGNFTNPIINNLIFPKQQSKNRNINFISLFCVQKIYYLHDKDLIFCTKQLITKNNSFDQMNCKECSKKFTTFAFSRRWFLLKKLLNFVNNFLQPQTH